MATDGHALGFRDPHISFPCFGTSTMSDFEEDPTVEGGAVDEENEEVEEGYDEEQDEQPRKDSRRNHDDDEEEEEEEEEDEEEEDPGVERGKKRRVRTACIRVVHSCH